MAHHPPSKRTPIAIIGLSCQLPAGVDNIDALSDFCAKARCSARPYPEHRFKAASYYHPASNKKGHFNTRAGSFLDRDIHSFDASFFNLTAAEAVAMDPQQRLLLECAFTAVENAGLDVNELSGRSDVGVFTGGSKSDYDSLINLDQFTATRYAATGNAMTMFSNRISYFFNWRGPSIVVDAACSSSLTALHLAVESLARGECSTALVGGSFLQLSPMLLSHMAAIGAVSQDGISYSFDSRANGYGRGEGAGCLVLRRAVDATEARDSIRAIIRSTGVNHCGTSPGITVPSETAQTELIRTVYASAGLDPRETAFVECHGTGTSKGDPIEARSVAAAFDTRSRMGEDPLYIGSSKSNFGHLEGGSGILSVLKAIVMLEREIILPNANFEKPNPDIDFASLRLQVPTACIPWPSKKAKRVSISNYGFGGSNAHAILEGPPATPIDVIHSSLPSEVSRLYIISAKSEASLRRNIAALRDYVEGKTAAGEDTWLQSLSMTLLDRRTRFRHSHAVVASSRKQLLEKLSAPLPAKHGSTKGPLTFVFTGQGAQWPGNGVDLMSNTYYAAAMREADQYLLCLGASWSLIEEVTKPAEISRISEAAISQPATTALQLALVVLLRKCGLQPARVCGHSSGEIAAAYAAGVLDFKTALAVAYYRGVAASELESSECSSDQGAMMAVGTDVATIRPLLSSLESGLATIACFNSPKSLTISGDVSAISELQEKLDAMGIFARKLQVRTAYHSDHMYRVVGHYLQDLQKVFSPSKMSQELATFHSSVTESTVHPSMVASPNYWAMNLICPVRFFQTMQSLLDADQVGDAPRAPPVIIEIGPHAALRGPIREITTQHSYQSGRLPPVYLPSLQRGAYCCSDLHQLLASVINNGQPVQTRCLESNKGLPPAGSLLNDLPVYQFDRERTYQHLSRLQTAALDGGTPWNTMLGHRVGGAVGDEIQFRHVFALEDIPWLADHEVDGSIVFPMAGYISAVIEALRHCSPDMSDQYTFSLREIVIHEAFLISDEDDNEMFTTLRPHRADTRSNNSTLSFNFEVLSWTVRAGFAEHCRGMARLEPSVAIDGSIDETGHKMRVQHGLDLQSRAQASCRRVVGADELYEAAADRGLRYGPAFQGVTDLKTGAQMAYGGLKSVDTSGRMPVGFESPLTAHPAWLDAALHVGLCNLGGNNGDPKQIRAHVPTFVKDLRFHLAPRCRSESVSTVYVHNVDTSTTASTTSADITVFDQGASTPVLEICGLQMFQTSEFGNATGISDAEIINPSTVEWFPHPEFTHSLQLAANVLGGDAEEESRRQNLERLSLYLMADAVAATTQLPKASHLRMFYEWAQQVANPEDPSSSNGRWSEWLTCSPADRRTFQEILVKEHPDSVQWANIGSQLPLILQEKLDPLQVLMEDDMLFNIYEQSSIFQRSFRQLAEMVDLLSRQNPWLRILEVGAGTGGCTSRILEKIMSPSPRFECYEYTDISTGFFEAARIKFHAASAQMKFRRLDICADVAQQGFELGNYDLIIAADVIHATPSIEASLSNIRKLLKPNGSLALVELSSVTPSMFPFATLPGWWLRGNECGAYVPEESWRSLLTGSGFAGIKTLVKDLPQDHLHSVIWTRPSIQRSPLPRTVTILEDSKASIRQPSGLDIKLLQDLGVKANVQDLQAVDTFHQGPYICLHELHRPLLALPTDLELKALQKFFTSATEVLWITKSGKDCDGVGRALYDFAFGFARSLRREHAGLRLVVLQVDEWDTETTLSNVASVFRHCFVDNADSNDLELDLRIGHGVVQFPRLAPHAPMQDALTYKAGDVKTEERPFVSGKHPLFLDMAHTGSMDSMIFRPASWMKSAPPLGDHELIIEIKATGLNFKDVLIALGSLPWQGLGRECCGVVVSVGVGLSAQYKVGDSVLHWGTDLFATHARCQEQTIVKTPMCLSPAEAAAIPVVYSTAYECLVNVARLQKDEKVLVHAAAGGVGQAAIMLATWIGAEIYCTVGTLDKKSLLMSKYGISGDRIFSSRSTSFAESLLLATKHQGVDVVLNSLSDDMFQSTWRCLSHFGRFIDIGKKHFVSNAHLELNPFDKSITYASVDLSLLIEHRGFYVHKLMLDVVELFNKHVLQPPTPVHQVPVSDVQSAFRTMQAGKVMGKTIIINDASSVVTAEVQMDLKARIRSNASYLITGGTRGLGLELVRQLVNRGAKYVVLVSRSGGVQTSGSPLNELMAWAHKKGAQVLALACDVSLATDVSALVCKLTAEQFPEVRGVIHGAMVLKDTLFEKATPDDWSAVVNPKVRGALNLHDAMLNTTLDFFVCLSSVVAISGNLGQSSYSGSNAFLDAFCRYRQQQGLPAVSVNLPAISEVGYVAEAMHTNKAKSLENFHAAAMTPAQFWSVLDSAIAMTSPRTGHGFFGGHIVAGLAALKDRNKMYQGSGPLLNLLYRATEARSFAPAEGSEQLGTAKSSLKHQLAGADFANDSAKAILFAGIAEKVSSILMVPPEDVTPEVSLEDLGLDSLIAVELRNWLVRELGVAISVIDIANSSSVGELSEKVTGRIVR